jgi:hypothetical protein
MKDVKNVMEPNVQFVQPVSVYLKTILVKLTLVLKFPKNSKANVDNVTKLTILVLDVLVDTSSTNLIDNVIQLKLNNLVNNVFKLIQLKDVKNVLVTLPLEMSLDHNKKFVLKTNVYKLILTVYNVTLPLKLVNNVNKVSKFNQIIEHVDSNYLALTLLKLLKMDVKLSKILQITELFAKLVI